MGKGLYFASENSKSAGYGKALVPPAECNSPRAASCSTLCSPPAPAVSLPSGLGGDWQYPQAEDLSRGCDAVIEASISCWRCSPLGWIELDIASNGVKRPLSAKREGSPLVSLHST